jgi:hypothetical protein
LVVQLVPIADAGAGDPGICNSEGLAQRMFHHRLSLQAGAYQNSTWVVAVAKAGVEDGH